MKLIMLSLLSFVVSSCSTVIVPEADGSDRSDGTVDFTYSLRTRIRADIDWNQVQEQAVSRCSAWGYQDAQSLYDTARVCINRDSSSGFRIGGAGQIYNPQSIPQTGIPTGACSEYKYTVTYQCAAGGN